jgi:hypothetical protein
MSEVATTNTEPGLARSKNEWADLNPAIPNTEWLLPFQ